MANIRDCLVQICTEWESARKQPFSNHPLAGFIRKDFRECIVGILEDSNPDVLVKGSAGAGNWASVPWLSILDPTITTSTTEGYYVVYLFKGDGSGVYLSLNQGTTGPKEQLGSLAAEEQARRIIKSFRESIPGLDAWLENIHLAASTPLGTSYEPSNIGARFYPSNMIPSEEVLIRDLETALSFAVQARPLWTRAFAKSDGAEFFKGLAMRASPIIPKPFLILAGISGTGKTRWVRKIAERTGDGKCNIRLIPVRPDWHEPSDLLGYTSRISNTPEFVSTPFLTFLVDAWKNAWRVEQTLATSADSVEAMTPHWACLDEMNLAPVEQYFADYLSVLESRSWDGGTHACDPLLSFDGRSEEELEAIRVALFGTEHDAALGTLWDSFRKASKPGIPLPPNLIVVGTVNMDETTHAFSRKVLDRAFTVEFDTFTADQYRSGKGIDPVFGIELDDDMTLPTSMVLSTSTSGKEVTGFVRVKVDALIDAWNGIMAETPFRVAYRTLNESLLYAASKGEDKISEAIDGILMMKLLPRLEGDSEKLGYDGEQSLESVDELEKLGEAKNTLIHAAWLVAKTAIGTTDWTQSKSKKKLHYMAKRLARTGYTSFWP